MIEPLTDVPDGVIAFEAVGKVHAADYTEVLIPAVDRAAAAGGVRLVYLLGDRFDGYSAGADWEDLKLGIAHLKAWKRAAIVTDNRAFGDLVAAFAWMVPGKMRHFPMAERATAIDWVTQD
jgi:hypothetical protein